MNRFLLGCALMLATAAGCRTCENSTDYLPPVLDGPYSPGMRNGSATSDFPIPGRVIDEQVDEQIVEPYEESIPTDPQPELDQ